MQSSTQAGRQAVKVTSAGMCVGAALTHVCLQRGDASPTDSDTTEENHEEESKVRGFVLLFFFFCRAREKLILCVSDTFDISIRSRGCSVKSSFRGQSNSALECLFFKPGAPSCMKREPLFNVYYNLMFVVNMVLRVPKLRQLTLFLCNLCLRQAAK
jgi:hypothetical protein